MFYIPNRRGKDRFEDSLYEFYGVMIGDGCVSKYKSSNKEHFEIGIYGNSLTDLHYFENNLKKIIFNLTKRRPNITYRKDCNCICLRFNSKEFASFLKEIFNFPIGKKGRIGIHNSLLNNWEKLKWVIRGIFDTDGSLYFTKNDYHKKRNYPIIEIVSNSDILIKQLYSILTLKGFIVRIGHYGKSIKLHGKKNLKAWMGFIGSSHIDKISKFLFWQKYGECPTNRELPLNERLRKLDIMGL